MKGGAREVEVGEGRCKGGGETCKGGARGWREVIVF